MRFLPLLLAVWPLQSLAETPLSAEAFEGHVTGKTITYTLDGTVFGIEEYMQDRKVRWSVAADLCQYGTWYPDGDNICFVYGVDGPPRCWTFWLRDGTLVALFDGGGIELQESAISDKGLPCAPQVGV